MLGSGYLALPNAFTEGGIISSSAILVGVLVVMIMTCLWEGRCVVKCGRVIHSSKVPEVAEAMNLYCGSKWRDVYILILAISHFIACSAYAILFARTFSYSLPQIYHSEVSCIGEFHNEVCVIRYSINILILGIITTPLALMDVKEQAWLQNALAIMRIFRIVLMCITALLSVGTDAMEKSFPAVFGSGSAYEPPPLFFGSWNGIFVTVSVGVFALLLNSAIPVIVDAMRSKKNFVRVLVRGFLISFALYLAVAIIISVKFSNKSDNPSNLNWHQYRLPYDNCENGSGGLCDVTSNLIEFFVVFCPVFDVISIFPISTIIFANSICEYVGIIAHSGIATESNNHSALSTSALEEHKQNIELTTKVNETTWLSARSHMNAEVSYTDISPSEQNTSHNSTESTTNIFLVKCVRFGVNVLPLILALLVPDFMNVIQCAGAVSVLVGLAFPAYMSMQCDSFESKNKFYYDLINEKNHLHWIDTPLSLSNNSAGNKAQSTNPFDENYIENPFDFDEFDKDDGALSNNDTSTASKNTTVSNSRTTSRKVYSNPEDDFIEKKSVKVSTLIIGIFVTAIIFYVSF